MQSRYKNYSIAEVLLTCTVLPIMTLFAFSYVKSIQNGIKNVSKLEVAMVERSRIQYVCRMLKKSFFAQLEETDTVRFINAEPHPSGMETLYRYFQIFVNNKNELIFRKVYIDSDYKRRCLYEDITIMNCIKKARVKYYYLNSKDWEDTSRKEVRSENDILLMINLEIENLKNEIIFSQSIDCTTDIAYPLIHVYSKKFYEPHTLARLKK